MDLLIIAGSQQLIDYIGGPWQHAYTIFKWALIAKLTRTKVVFLSVGVGPLGSRMGKFFVRSSLALAAYRSYRDESSKLIVNDLRILGEQRICPDLVYSLEIKSSTEGTRVGFCPTVGINPVPFYDQQYWVGASAVCYEAYTRKLCDFALWLIQRGYRILFFPTQLTLDPPVIDDIKKLMLSAGGFDFEDKIVNKPVSSFEDLISAIDITQCVVATRFHGIVIPYALNKPVIGIAYQRKTNDLMSQMGQSEFVVDINTFDVDLLKTRFLKLEQSLDAIRMQIERSRTVFRRKLHDQYDCVLDFLKSENVRAAATESLL
jgi:polysaccharide pyruvyl transferase WcaK-like protein